MKENRTGMHEKRSSIPNYRRTSVVTNPFLLSEIAEESYDSSSEPISNADKLPKTSLTAPLLQKQTRGGGVSFKSVAKAITKQRNWSTVLKVSCKPRWINQVSSDHGWRMQMNGAELELSQSQQRNYLPDQH